MKTDWFIGYLTVLYQQNELLKVGRGSGLIMHEELDRNWGIFNVSIRAYGETEENHNNLRKTRVLAEARIINLLNADQACLRLA
jgi:hypothetical protein